MSSRIRGLIPIQLGSAQRGLDMSGKNRIDHIFISKDLSVREPCLIFFHLNQQRITLSIGKRILGELRLRIELIKSK